MSETRLETVVADAHQPSANWDHLKMMVVASALVFKIIHPTVSLAHIHDVFVFGRGQDTANDGIAQHVCEIGVAPANRFDIQQYGFNKGFSRFFVLTRTSEVATLVPNT